MPELLGSTTPRAKAAATAASTALPPRRSIEAPASAASGWAAATAPRGETAGKASSRASIHMAAHYNFCYLACPYGPRPLRPLAHRLPAHRRGPHRAVQLAVGATAEGQVHPPRRGHRPVPQHAGERAGHPPGNAVARSRLGRGPAGGRAARALFPDAAARHLPEV